MKITNPYLCRFFASNCLSDLVPYYANYTSSRKRDKEITESVGCFEAAEDAFGKLDDYHVYVIGDGVLPRTASVFAHFCKAGVFSIDPLMRVDYLKDYFKFKESIGRPVRRLKCFDMTFEDFDVFDGLNKFGFKNGKKNLVVMPHSHAKFNETIEAFNRAGIHPDVVAMPCCVKIPQETLVKHKPTNYQDFDILSGKNHMYIFKQLNLL